MDRVERQQLAERVERDIAELTILVPATAVQIAAMSRLERRIRRGRRLLAALRVLSGEEGAE